MSDVSEVWVSIAEAPSYQVSSLGRVRGPHGLIKPWSNGRGYLKVSVWHCGCRIKRYVHRLVAQAFLELDPAKPEVNHINGDTGANQALNLEWVDSRGNKAHARDVLGVTQGKPAVPVLLKSLETGCTYSFPSYQAAARDLGIHRSNLFAMSAGRRRSAGGFVIGDSND